MDWGLSAILATALGGLLLLAGIEDARRREIANWKTAAVAALAPLWWWVNGRALIPDVALQLGLALLVFGLFCFTFARGWMGGGDVKLIGALALWFPAGAFATFLLVMSLVGGGLTLAMLAERAVRRLPRGAIEIPYGVAIAIAGLLALREPIFNQIT